MNTDDPILRSVEEYSSCYDLLPASGLVLAAVSGGADSMCLLEVLRGLSLKYGFSVAAAHFNHRLRGEESDRDEHFVREYCAGSGIPLTIGSGDVAKEAAQAGHGIEETARQMRYRFLRETAGSIGADRIATAHNANDNTETVLLHLVRGTGLRGLCGISPKRGDLIRPLLGVSREDIESCCTRNRIPYITDSTNSDAAYTRNYLRLKVIPLLKELNPRLNKSIARMTAGLRQEEAVLLGLLEPYTDRIICGERSASLPVEAVRTVPEALRPVLIGRAAEAADPEVNLSAVYREQGATLALSDKPSGFFRIPGGMVIRREYDLMRFSYEETRPVPSPAVLTCPGSLEWGGWVLTAEPAVYDGEPQRKQNFCLNAEQVTVRSRCSGDELTPVGRCRKSLRKWMIEEKIPEPERAQIPVLLSGDKIAAVVSIGADISAHPKRGESCIHIKAVKKE